MWIDTILEHGASWVCECGCVGPNLDKEVKFYLMAGQLQKRSLEAYTLLRLKSFLFQKLLWHFIVQINNFSSTIVFLTQTETEWVQRAPSGTPVMHDKNLLFFFLLFLRVKTARREMQKHFRDLSSFILTTDYGHTMAKSLILCGPNSNPSPK